MNEPEQKNEPSALQLAWLIERYLPTLRGYLIGRRRLRPEDADDLLQGFIADQVLERDLMAHARAGAGGEAAKVRAFVIRSLDNYLRSEYRKRNAQKRAPDSATVPIDAAAGVDPVDDSDADNPGAQLDAAWALQIIAATLVQMVMECESTDRLDVWNVFARRIAGPTADGVEPAPYEQLSEELNLDSPAKAANLLVTAKRMFMRILAQVMRDEGIDEADVESEIAQLSDMLGGSEV